MIRLARKWAGCLCAIRIAVLEISSVFGADAANATVEAWPDGGIGGVGSIGGTGGVGGTGFGRIEPS